MRRELLDLQTGGEIFMCEPRGKFNEHLSDDCLCMVGEVLDVPELYARNYDTVTKKLCSPIYIN